VQREIAQFGVVATLDTGKPGKTLLIRADMDALEVVTQVVSALQRITSRHMNPLKPAVVTVGSFHAGSTFNVIPGTAEMSGTVRTFDREIWLSWRERLETIIRGVCDSMGATYELTYEQGYPLLQNNRKMASLDRECAAEAVGREHVNEPEPAMVGDDMAYFLEKSEGCFILLGVGRKEQLQLHNPRFDFNEKVLPLGVEFYCRYAFSLLAQ
jgi:amidohydrolase